MKRFIIRVPLLVPLALSATTVCAQAATAAGNDNLVPPGVLAALVLLALPAMALGIRRWSRSRATGPTRQNAEHETIEHALRESRRRYQEVVESINEVIFRTDPDGRLSFLNHAWERISGYPVADSLGRELPEFLHPDDMRPTRELLSQLARGERTECHCELRLRTSGGEIRWIEAAGRAVHNGEFQGLAGTLDDISARKVAESTLKNLNQELETRVRIRTAELEASNRELEAFSYSVSHDLRAPLRAIDGFAQILEEELADKLEPSSRAHLNRIRNATQRMSQLIDDLIGLAHLTRQPLKHENVDLSELATQILDELRAEEPQRQVEIHITPHLQVRADRNLMRIVLENLLRNAWKFSAHEPRPRISLSAEYDREQRIFCVSDNGAGFDMAFASNLFRPFHRLHSNSEFVGTGIGLANVQRIIQRHGGLVWAQARPREGARFYFTLDD